MYAFKKLNPAAFKLYIEIVYSLYLILFKYIYLLYLTSNNFQETMMTPRSRKPVVALSNSNIHKMKPSNSDSSISNLPSRQSLNSMSSNPYHLMTSGDSLSSSFRDYLFSQSVLTASPVDLSFGDTSASSTQSLQSDLEDGQLQFSKSTSSTESLLKRKRMASENFIETLL